MPASAGRSIEVPMPLAGLAEDQPTSKQSPATARVFRNVVAVDPRTGKVRLSSRAGFSRLTSLPVCGADQPIQALAAFNRALLRTERVTLTGTPQPGVTPAQVDTVWSVAQQGSIVALDVLPLFDVVVLLNTGQMSIINPDGATVATVRSPLPVGFRIVPHLVVDEFGGIVFGAAIDVAVEGGSGRLYRYVRSDRDLWVQDWTLALDGQLVHFDMRGGEIVAIERPIGGDNDGRDELVRLAGALGEPVIESRRSVAWPAYTVTLDASGAALVASPPNPLRGDPTTAFTERNESWTPRELPDWKTRIHAWFDGLRPTQGIEGRLAGDPVGRLDDARFYPSGFGVADDSTVRTLTADVNGDFSAPEWDPDAFGGLGAPRFASGTTVATGLNRDTSDRTKQEALIPGTSDKWALCFVVQVDVDALAAATDYRILSHVGDGAQLGLRLVARLAGGGFELDVQDLSGSRGSGTTTAAAQTMLVTIYHDGAGSTSSRLRINGAHDSNMQFSQIVTGGAWDIATATEHPGPMTVWGEHRAPAPFCNVARRAPAWFLTNALIPSIAERLRDGVVSGGSANRVKLLVGSDSLRVQFDGTDLPTVDGLATWTSNVGSQALRVRVTASNHSFASVQRTWEFALDERQQFPARHWLDFGELATYEFWELTVLQARGSGSDWGLTEVEFLRRAEHDELAPPLPDGSAAIPDGASMALGEAILLLNPTEPGAVNIGGSSVDPATATDVENLEGYLAHRFGIAHLLPVDHLYYGAGNYPVGVGDVTVAATDRGANNAPGGILAKYAPNGALLAARTGPGYGYGAAVDDDGFVWSVGPRQGSGSQAWLRRLRDEGQRLEVTGEGTVTLSGGDEVEPALQPIVPRVDGAGILHLSLVRASGESRYLRVDSTGAEVSSWALAAGTTPSGVALGPDVITVDTTLARGAEWAYLGAGGVTSSVARLALIGSRETGETRQRSVGLATVSCGSVFVHDVETGALAEVGGAEVFDERARIAATSAFGRLFLSDGRRSMVYDPRTRVLAPMRATGYGAAPSGFGLVELWQGRLVLGRLEDDPAAVFATARGDADNYDLFPPVPLQGQAFVLAALDRIGRLPEPVTALAAVDDDLLLIGTTTSLAVLSGDPTQGAGLDNISTEVGMPLGQAWCRDPFGRVHFLDDAGRVWRWSRTEGLQELTSSTVRERLRRVDWMVYAPELRWAHYADGFFLYIVPRSLVAEPLAHLFWGATTGAWSEITFDDLALQPTASAQIDGDNEATRLHVIGCADGHLRYWDRTASTDDGWRIDSDVLIGPMGAPSGLQMMRAQHFEVDLAQEQGGALLEVHAGDTAEQPGRRVMSWPIGAGPNGPALRRVKARWLWLRVRNRNTGEPFALERASFTAFGAGRRRIRRGS
jgi:hypothetical protein